jgi:hypothetical protein
MEANLLKDRMPLFLLEILEPQVPNVAQLNLLLIKCLSVALMELRLEILHTLVYTKIVP